jgi:HAD superfamily hydrolase (TIGR01509 family)
MTKLKAVIFDMDGTLVDSIPFHKESWISFLNRHDIELDPDQFQSQNRGNIEEMIRKFFGETIPTERLVALGNEKEDIYRDLYRQHIREIDGLTNFLLSLKKENIKIALATMGDPNNINFILDTTQIHPFFQYITGGNEISKGKPDPEIYKLSLKKMNLQNTECVVFEDSLDGICAAKLAGLKVIGITTTHTAEELEKAGCVFAISDFTDISIANLNDLLS